MVRKTKTGFSTAFRNANTIAKIKAVKKLFCSILTPGNNHAVIKTATADRINFIIKFMCLTNSAKITNLAVWLGTYFLPALFLLYVLHSMLK